MTSTTASTTRTALPGFSTRMTSSKRCSTNNTRRRRRSYQRCQPLLCVWFVFVFVSATLRISSAQAQTQTLTLTLSEEEILIRLFDQTQGDSWRSKDQWKINENICEWYGITCNDQSRVISIQLDRNNLNGALPEQLWQLEFLQEISVRSNLITSANLQGLQPADRGGSSPRSPLQRFLVADNHLTSMEGIRHASATLKQVNANKNHVATRELIQEVTQCTLLESLFLSFNDISGTLPTEIGSLTQLTDLYLFDNRLEGQIPSEIGFLHQLQVLGLGNNQFAGTLPTEMEQLVNLKDLSIHHVEPHQNQNQNRTRSIGLTGPLLTFGNMPNLSLLFLDGNSLTGTIPTDFLRHNTLLSKPVSIGLTQNQLTGRIPSNLDRFEALSLDLVGNPITEIPDNLCLKGGWMGGLVEEFHCDAILCRPGTYNILGRAFAANHLCEPCSALRDSTIYGSTTCAEDGSTGSNSNEAKNHEAWYILANFYMEMLGQKWTIQTGWNEAFFTLVSGDTTLAEFSLSLEVDICDGWYGIICDENQQITDISLPNNGLYGEVPNSIFNLPSLQVFDISNNNVQMNDLLGVVEAKKLTSMRLSNVKIQSLFGIGQLSNTLQRLFLDGMELEAEIPTQLFQLTTLQTLHLQHGHFTGKIPTEIGQLTELQDLNIYGNRLTGILPEALGQLSRLRYIDISENQFTGLIPSLDALSDLETFAIHQTEGVSNLDGPLPAFNSFPRLKEVSLEYNALTGPIPSNFLARIQDKSSEITVSLGFNQLEGEIPNSLNAFDKLVLNLEGNKITGIPTQLCNRLDWMRGEVGTIGDSAHRCDAILCPPGTWNEFGKATVGSPCFPCENGSSSTADDNEWAFWFGRISCGDITPSREKEILDKLFTATGGRYWKIKHENWLRPGVPICEREGVECLNAGANEGVLELRMNRFGLRGTIPNDIWELTSARQLAFTQNEVEVSFKGIEKAESLIVLKLSNCHLRTLEGLDKVSEKLAELHVAENQLSGTVPNEIFQLVQVKELFMHGNDFDGTIPEAFSQLEALAYLDISDNRFTGPLPANLGSLSDLTHLEVQLNDLSGTLPSEILGLQQLTHLDISRQSGTKFQGVLPSFDKSPLLTYIDASENGFSGQLPSNILPQVDFGAEITLNLAKNRFEGAVPAEWSKFQSLSLELGGNRITSLPDILCQQEDWQKGQLGESGSCDAILCPPGAQAPMGRESATDSCELCMAGEMSAPHFGTTACLDPRLVEEKLILINFYENTNGTSWLVQTDWLSDGPVCGWYGIVCNEEQHVTEIGLETNMIAGGSDAVSDILRLADLKLLDLKGNRVRLNFGKIPNDSKLETLRLSNTGISSLVGLSRAKGLKYFHGTNNEIRSIPEELYSMTGLESLFLSYNSIAGSLSSSFGRIANLKELYMFGNHLTGQLPSEFGYLANMTELVLGRNFLSGTIPEEITTLPSLQQLSIQEQQGSELITGLVPTFLQATNLVFFDATGNDLSGTIPKDFMANSVSKNATISIFLRNNDISGTIPAELKQFNALNINLADNNIVEIPSVLCGMKGWMQGKVGEVGECSAILCPPRHFNQFGHESPGNPCVPCSDLEGDPRLGQTRCKDYTSERDTLNKVYQDTGGAFWTDSNNWNSEAPICSWAGVYCKDGNLQDSEGITVLRLDGNALSGPLPTEVWTLPSLRHVSLRNNPSLQLDLRGLENAAGTLEVLDLSETGLRTLSGIARASSLKELRVSSNSLRGTFPSEILSLSETLASLYISNNRFYGTLPTELGRFSNLQVLHASLNDFFSTIPSEIGKLSFLKRFVLGDNLLYGTIPSALGSLPALEVFDASRRMKSGPRLSGTLPPFDKVPQLKEIYLDGNNLQGPVGETFLSASNGINTVQLSSNLFTGAVPSSLHGLSNITLDLTGNRITLFPGDFCENSDWMEGDVAEFGCDGIMCAPGTASPIGRATDDSTMCVECSKERAASYFGSSSCDSSLSEREILVNLFYALGGKTWHRNDFWGSTADICNWYGIGCIGGHVAIVNLRGNNLRGTPGPDLFHLPELRTLWLYSNPIEFSFEGIGTAKKLQDLRLDSTNVRSINGIRAATSLVSFDAGFSRIRGPFPQDEILSLSHLRTLHLNNNHLSGTLPNSFSNMEYLVRLRLDSNKLSGKLPSFDDMNFLEYIDVSNNRLNGPIEKTLFQSLGDESKPTLRLSQNQITGIVPEELDRFKEMSLFLSDNQILGLPFILCDNDLWNNGAVGQFGCDAIMCKPGTANAHGRRTPDTKCEPCITASYYGDTSCRREQEESGSLIVSAPCPVVSMVFSFLVMMM